MANPQTVAELLEQADVTEAAFEVYATFQDPNGGVSNTRSVSPTFDSAAEATAHLSKLKAELGDELPETARVVRWVAY